MDPRQVELGQVVAITCGMREGYIGKIVGTAVSNKLVRLSGLRCLILADWTRPLNALELLALEAE